MCTTDQAPVQQCFFISTAHTDDLLYRNVERLWQLDVLPFHNEKLVVRSRQDNEAMQLLESQTQQVSVQGVQRYATPLLWKPDALKLKGSMQSVLANLRSTERRLQKDPKKASINSGEIAKLIKAGYVAKLNQREAAQAEETWYLPHHLVSHNNKPSCLVLPLDHHCSSPTKGQTRLELCAALAGAQLARLVKNEMTLSISQTVLWTDSLTVLEWIQSDSCRYKVFVGTRVSEMQELTDHRSWRYVNTQENPADDITRGKSLQSLAEPSRWSQGPPFLKQSQEHWPKKPELTQSEEASELKGLPCYCLIAVNTASNIPDSTQFSSWSELVEATRQACQGVATSDSASSEPMTSKEAEAALLRACQLQSFPEEVAALKAQKSVPAHSRLVSLAPEWDPLKTMIRVGGRLRRLANSDPEQIHPIVLDPRHAVTKLLIKEFDERLLHPGAERVYAEIRRQY
ncbi:uncharacterized protein [Sinocyclocheilus grahami]|uniref:uncharacterized protein n=1 Tax=Sinocyclocheilus grahami TaxID=75366 RepID=UPI0007ACC48B|nr:PREDICTED: uncharacterized protein LOC107588774 [Sinocyclocheilus grahami]